MRSYSATEVFTRRAQRLLEDATSLVAHVDVRRLGLGTKPLRCHELARGVCSVLKPYYTGLHVIDGKYGAVEHSWIKVSGSGAFFRSCYLDVYAVGRLPQVQLADTSSLTGDFQQYQWGEQRRDIDFQVLGRLTAHLEVVYKKRLAAKRGAVTAREGLKKFMVSLVSLKKRRPRRSRQKRAA